MSIAVLPHPPDSIAASLTEPVPVDRIGQYSVTDPAFVRKAAAALMNRCVLCDCEISPRIAEPLGLRNGDRNAIGMAEALLAIADLEQRRAIICLMVHDIVRLR